MSQILDLRIRRATPEDRDLLADLGLRTFSETFAAENTPEDLAAYVAASFSPGKLASELGDPAAAFLIAEIAGRPTGYVKLYRGAAEPGIEGINPLELVRLYVLREWLGRGVGEALMRACVEEARRGGHDTLWLGVWERNARAQAFYRKWQFREVGEHVFQLGSDAQRDILMVRVV